MAVPNRTRSPRRAKDTQRPDIRAELLDAAEALVREEGYFAATVRRIAERVGLKHPAVFYYYGSQEDLLLALFRRHAERQRERLVSGLNSGHPVTALWDVVSDPDATRFALEFMALANHNEVIRAELAQHAEAVRELEVEALARHFAERGIEPRLSPEVVSILTTGLARILVQEATLGIKRGHEETQSLVRGSLRQFEQHGQGSAEGEVLVTPMKHPR